MVSLVDAPARSFLARDRIARSNGTVARVGRMATARRLGLRCGVSCFRPVHRRGRGGSSAHKCGRPYVRLGLADRHRRSANVRVLRPCTTCRIACRSAGSSLEPRCRGGLARPRLVRDIGPRFASSATRKRSLVEGRQLALAAVRAGPSPLRRRPCRWRSCRPRSSPVRPPYRAHRRPRQRAACRCAVRRNGRTCTMSGAGATF